MFPIPETYKDICKTVHMTSVAQHQFSDATRCYANLTAQLVFYQNEPNISAPASVSPLERDWSTKPIIYIINNSLAFRYVTSQIWKYYGIFGFVPNERGRIHEHKAPFRKQLSAQAFKVYSFISLCERRVQNQHMVTSWVSIQSCEFNLCANWNIA